MNQVWFLFQILELFGGSTCLYIHIAGSLTVEPLPHNLLFCGTFGSFTLLAGVRLIKLSFGGRTLLHPSLLFNLAGTLMYFICALVSMHYAERDFHLQFMDNVEEWRHSYFQFCRKVSSASITTGSLHLLQCILVMDLIVKTPPYEDLKPIKIVTEPPEREDKFQGRRNEDADLFARKIADIYFLGANVDHWLRIKSKWFRQLAGGQELNSLYDQTPTSSNSTQSDDELYEFNAISLINVPDEQAEKIDNPFEKVLSIRDVTQSGDSITVRNLKSEIELDSRTEGTMSTRSIADMTIMDENSNRNISVVWGNKTDRKGGAKEGDKTEAEADEKAEDKKGDKTEDKPDDKKDKA